YASMKELKHALEACMDKLGISKELPQADDSDTEIHAIDAKPPSFPGARTPGRPTGPISKNRISNPNARAAPVRSQPRPPAAMARASQPPTQLTPVPQKGSTALFIGIGALAVAAVAVGAFVLLRGPERRDPPPPAARAQVETPNPPAPVFLSV